MKKLLLIIFIFATSSAISCSNPKEETSQEEPLDNSITEQLNEDVVTPIEETGNYINSEVETTEEAMPAKKQPVQSKSNRLSPEAFGESVYKALKENNYDKIKPFLPTTNDIEYLRDFEIKNDPAMKDSKKASLLAKLKKFQKNKIENSKESFDKIYEKIEEKGIVWKDAKFERAAFKRGKKKDLEQGDVYIFLNYLGAEYIIEMTNCIKVERGWLIGDKMTIK